MKIIIVGAGVAGLAAGWRLAQAKCDVVVLERGLAGQGATWASAGMIAPGFEFTEDGSPEFQLAQASRAAWPAFAREIESASGMDIAFREPGALLAAFDDAQEENLRKQGRHGKWLSAKEAQEKVPLLSPQALGALHATDTALVDNRALGPALAAAFARAGGKLRELCAAQSLATKGGRVCGVVLENETLEADAVVLAAGAWCSGVGAMPPVRPVKGQMLALAPPDGAKLPACPVTESHVYIVPRRDFLLVGATVEEAGFDTAVTAEARDWLLAGAIRLAPTLAQWRVAESWAGLRPATPDGLPALGPAGPEGLFAATGQFRNGIMFAPAMADALCRFALGKALDPLMRAFDPRRFDLKAN